MRIRHAASTLVALGAASACALGASMIAQDHEAELRDSELRASAWSVQASTDFGTTWTADMATGYVGIGYGDSGMTQQVPDEVKAAVEELAAKIASGEIVVETTRA